MLSREAVYTMLQLRKKNISFFSKLPIDLIKEISDFNQDPESEISKALQHAAYACEENVMQLLAMLDKNPTLLLEAGNVVTPGGDKWKRVTIYEFLLGAGDFVLAQQVQKYFSTIEHGERQRIHQFKRYQPHMEGMLTRKPYDITPLIELIKHASTDDVNALLNKDMTRQSKLCDAIVQFRKDWAPRTFNQPGMHYNYASLKHAFDILEQEFSNLYKSSADNFDKIRIVWRQLIGFEMRRLPGIDRCVMAQGLHDVVNERRAIARSYKFANSDGEFPIIASDDLLNGLGGDCAADIYGQMNDRAGGTGPNSWTIYIQRKLKLTGLKSPEPIQQFEYSKNKF